MVKAREAMILGGFLGSFLWAASAFAGAVIEGRVILPESGDRQQTLIERYQTDVSQKIDAPDDPMAVVYLKGPFPPSKSPEELKENVRVMSQRQYQFAPNLMAIEKGMSVAFKNEDDDYHNILSYSKAKRFDLGRYRKSEKAPVITFDQAGVVKIYCEIHRHMRAALLVLETPYYTISDAEGRYRLEDLPAGRYTLAAWTPENGEQETQVTLEEGQVLKVDF